MREQIVEGESPYESAKALTEKWRGHWAYRVDAYRVICKIRRGEMLVMVVKAGPRGSVYN
jgi:mRNA interferase RelE/StbE